MSVTNLMHTATENDTEHHAPPAVHPAHVEPSTTCAWSRCERDAAEAVQTARGPRPFCATHVRNYHVWQTNKARAERHDAHSFIVQSPNSFSPTVTAVCTICHETRELDSHIDPAKFYVSAGQETARNSYQRDDDHDELGRLDACRDAAQAIEDDFRSTGMDAYGHDYADPPHFDSEPNELLNQATLGYLPDTSDCQHHAAYQDRTTLVSHRPSAYAGLGSPAYDTDRPYLDHSQPDGFCPDCDTDLTEQDDYSPIARAAVNEARQRIAAMQTNATNHSNQADRHAARADHWSDVLADRYTVQLEIRERQIRQAEADRAATQHYAANIGRILADATE